MAGIGVILASAVGFSWAATDAKDLERQKALRHHLSGKVRLPASTTHHLRTQEWETGIFARLRLIYSPCPHPRAPWMVAQPPALTPVLTDASPQFTDGDEELVKHVKRRASMFHPETPEQILHMQQTRHELTGKLVPRLTENR